MLADGYGDYYICDKQEALSTFADIESLDLTSCNSFLPNTNLAFMASNKNILNDIDDALGKFMVSDDYEILHSKWFSVNNDSFFIKHIKTLLIAISLIASIILLLNFILRRRVKITTKNINDVSAKLKELNHSFNMAIENAKITIFIYDIITDKLTYIENGKYIDCFEPFTKKTEHIHPNDKKRFFEDLNKIKEGVINKCINEARVFVDKNKEYLEYEFTFSTHNDDPLLANKIGI